MVHKHQSIEISLSGDIFQNDKLERKNAIEDLSSLLEATTQSFVLGLNADWGAGKTTFVKLWQAYLQKEKGMQSIYFSAWEDDFSKEPLISILGEIKKYINDNFSEKSDVTQSFEKVKSFSGKVLKRGVPAFLKGATGGVLDFDKGFEDAIGAITEATAKELIDNYSHNKEVAEEFKKALEELLSKIDKEKPFVIFIDELDRCRPLYAIELLERIKHVFGIDGLIFVLSIDKKQLVESIKSQYGNIDAQTYLRRFIDMEYNLQNPSLDKFCTYLYYDIYKFNDVMKSKNIEHIRDDLDMLKYLMKVLHMSLRDVEQMFTRLTIIYKTIQPRLLSIHFRIIVLFVSLKMKHPDKYELLIARQIDADTLLPIFPPQDLVNNYHTMFHAILLSTRKSEQEMVSIIKEQKTLLTTMQSGDLEAEITKQQRLIRYLESEYGNFGGYRLNEAIETVIQKVEFTDKFNFETTK